MIEALKLLDNFLFYLPILMHIDGIKQINKFDRILLFKEVFASKIPKSPMKDLNRKLKVISIIAWLNMSLERTIVIQGKGVGTELAASYCVLNHKHYRVLRIVLDRSTEKCHVIHKTFKAFPIRTS